LWPRLCGKGVGISAIVSETPVSRSWSADLLDAESHRVRGGILWKRDPVNTAPAEDAFLTAIAIAQQQKARSFEFRAALSLAKLYQSTARAADAYAVLAPALEGFSPTPEFPEIEEAQTLLEVLERDEDVKAESARRERRLSLQVAYGNALVSARGYAAPETAAALGRVGELAQGGSDPVTRISALYGDFLRALVKQSAQHMIDAARNAMEATNGSESSLPRGIAHRMMGTTFGYLGDFRAGKPHLERALAILEVQRDADLVTRFNENPLIGTRTRSAIDAWVRGEADASEAHAARAVAEAEALGHASTFCYVQGWKANLEALRRDPKRALVAAEAALAASERSGARVWVPAASIVRDWALHKRNGAEFGARLLEERLPALDEVGHDILFRPLLAGLAAEADVERPDEAMARSS